MALVLSVCVCVCVCVRACVYVWLCACMCTHINMQLSSPESGGNQVNPNHQPYMNAGGIVAEMQVYSLSGLVLVGEKGRVGQGEGPGG